ncbi:hypothetical protein ACQ1XD_004706 [Pseudomonas aeruginosa]|uniref:hypothetical protein n=1 Tax=Pseudomonas aeruginosa TaxID=287 RepID=UPI0005B41A2B|nr:hypothetical protein [Pseudomonas aeruginosa]EKB9387739.1 hypothetical protein [Pseudomonas aeruginosa]EKD1543890.1 hypothetical protein [Pseudomonas aeruginosa]EKU4830282.1 hypothetical protein [Pseudomonas aeruginosa]EKV8096550.1 hypothetical protein [Pseudomonas aeruginosa]EKW2946629.1 hypothetical protein [Pseudomonas aeruginosa]
MVIPELEALKAAEQEEETALQACLAFARAVLPANLLVRFQCSEGEKALQQVARSIDLPTLPAEQSHLAPMVSEAHALLSVEPGFPAIAGRWQRAYDLYDLALIDFIVAEEERAANERQHAQELADTYALIEQELWHDVQVENLELGLISVSPSPGSETKSQHHPT